MEELHPEYLRGLRHAIHLIDQTSHWATPMYTHETIRRLRRIVAGREPYHGWNTEMKMNLKRYE